MIGLFDTSAAPHLHRGYGVCTDDTCPHASVTGIKHAHGPGGRVQVLRDPTATAPGADDRCAKVDCGIPRREHGRGIHAFVEPAATVVAREVPDRKMRLLGDHKERRLYEAAFPGGFPWRLLAPHEEQAIRNHSQTLERLSDRGGLGPDEMVAIIEDRKWSAMGNEEALARLKTFDPPASPTPDSSDDAAAREIAANCASAMVKLFGPVGDSYLARKLLEQLATEALAAGEARGRGLERKDWEDPISKILVAEGCGCDIEGPHEGIPCEELGHDPCQMCQVERVLQARAAAAKLRGAQ